MNHGSGHAQWASRSWRFFPMVVLVTGAVFVLPIVVVWQLRSHGTVTSLWLAVAIGIAVSMGVSWVLRALWTRSVHRSELLFDELLVWGWISHLRAERKLASAAALLWVLEREADPVNRRRPRRPPATSDARWRLVRQLANAVDAQDVYLHGHSRRVALHAEKIGRRMGLSAPELARVRAAAAAHDVGKLCVPRAILDKPGTLTEEEFDLVKRHPDEGARIVGVLGDPKVTSIVRYHHERVDGHGYPAGLIGDAIPLGARIVAVADTFDAITSARPYRPAQQHRQAIATLRECAGTQLDPDVVRAFLASYAGRRETLVLAGLLAAPQQILSRLAGGRPSSPAATAANALAVVAASAAVAAAAGTPAQSGNPALSASVHSLPKASVLAAHIGGLRRHAVASSAAGHASPSVASSAGSNAGSKSPGKTSSSGRAKTGAGRRNSGSSRSAGRGGGSKPAGGGGAPRRHGASHGGGAPRVPKPPTVTGTRPTGSGPSSPPAGGSGTQTPAPPAATGTTSAPPAQTGTTSSSPPAHSGPPAGPGYTPMSSGTTTCNGTYGGSGDQVVVPAGDRCTLASGSHVGTITVKSGGSLIAQGVSVADDLQADGAATLTICGTTIEHDLQVQHAGGQVTIGGSCAGNTIGHDLHVQDNAAGVVVEGNQVGHDMHVQDNSGGSTVSANRVGHDAHCDAGTAGQGNTAGHKNDGCPA